MKSTFELWTVENPMTVISSPFFDETDMWKWRANETTQWYYYTVWDYKTMNLNTIKITLPLN